MGMWRRFKGWMKRTALRFFMRFVQTRLYKFLRKLAIASVVPLSIIAGATGVGVGVASAVAFPLVYGGLIGACAGVAAVVLTRVWLTHNEAQRRRTLTTFSVLSRKEKKPDSPSRGIFVPVVASSSSTSRGKGWRGSSRT